MMIIKSPPWFHFKTITFVCFAVLTTSTTYALEEIRKVAYEGQQEFVTSPDFPSCCSKDRNITITFRCSRIIDSLPGRFLFYFSDLDLTHTSAIGVYRPGPTRGSMLSAAFIAYNSKTKSWSSRVMTINSCDVIFGFIIRKSWHNEGPYTGFKLHYEYVSMLHAEPLRLSGLYYTSSGCRRNLEALAGGEVSVKPSSATSFTKVQYCTWQIKPLPGFQHTQVKTFLRINHLYLRGSLTIRSGISSDSPLLFQWNETERYLTSVNQPDAGFSSSGGFYIELFLNLSSNGQFGFVYGEYIISPLIDSKHKSCNFIHQYNVPGFYCAASQWCIPRSLICDQIQHCSQNEDEQLPACLTTSTVPTTTTTSTTTTTLTTTTPRYVRHTVWHITEVYATAKTFIFGSSTTPEPATKESFLPGKLKYIGVGLAFFLLCLSLYVGYRMKQRKHRPGTRGSANLGPSTGTTVNGNSGPASNVARPYRSVATQPGLEPSHSVNPSTNPMSNGSDPDGSRAGRMLPDLPTIYNRAGPRDSPALPPPSYNAVIEMQSPPSEPPPAFGTLELPPSYDQVMAETDNNINLQRTTFV